MMKYYTLRVRTLSPVHVGCGEQLGKLDYVYSASSRKIYVMHPRKLFFGLQKQNLLPALETQLTETTFSLSRFMQEQEITEEEYSLWTKYSYPVNNVSVENGQMEIHSFIKDAYGCPYIPGSSLKGALRTCIAYAGILADREYFAGTAEEIAAEIRHPSRGRKPSLHKYSASLNSGIFHTLKRAGNKASITNDCMTGLIVSDSQPLSPESLTLCQKIDIDYDGNPHSLNLLRECIAPGTDILFDLAVDDTLCPFRAEEILESAKALSEDYHYVFRSVFKSEVKDTLDEPVRNEGEFLYLGGGTGYPLKTVLFALYEDPVFASEQAAELLQSAFPKAEHRLFTARTSVSPKVWKCTRFNEKLYEMGLCTITAKEKKL